jgi:CheY-like chemotaxis protein
LGKLSRIILIDDNPVDRYLIKRVLEIQCIKCEIIEFEEPLEAVDYFNSMTPESVPDLIITDIQMPRMNGHALVRTIRANPILTAIPIVVLTSSTAKTDMDLAMAKGANTFVSKPLTMDKARQIVSMLGV